MPTFRHGKTTAVLLNGTDMSPYLNEATSALNIETAETTTFADDDKTYVAGLGDGTISASGLFDGSANASNAVLTGLIRQEDDTFTVLPEGATAGRQAILANGQLTSYEVSTDVGDAGSWSASLSTTGTISRA